MEKENGETCRKKLVRFPEKKSGLVIGNNFTCNFMVFNWLFSGLKRCGKSCRLRWLNYLRPDIKRGNISHDEEELIIRLHRLLGNRFLFFIFYFFGGSFSGICNLINLLIDGELLQMVFDCWPAPGANRQ